MVQLLQTFTPKITAGTWSCRHQIESNNQPKSPDKLYCKTQGQEDLQSLYSVGGCCSLLQLHSSQLQARMYLYVAVMRVPPAQRSLTAFSLDVCGWQQKQVLLKGCLSTELKEMRGSERVVWLQWPSQRASNTIWNTIDR